MGQGEGVMNGLGLGMTLGCGGRMNLQVSVLIQTGENVNFRCESPLFNFMVGPKRSDKNVPKKRTPHPSENKHSQ